MSVGQLTQRNSYNIYGNFFPNQSGTIENEGGLVFQTPGLVPPTYTTRRYYYSVVGNCVTFQALIEIQDKGNGTGIIKWQLPNEFPQGIVIPGSPNQELRLTISDITVATKYISYHAFINTGKEIELIGRKLEDGDFTNIDADDIVNDDLVYISGSYFT